MPLRNDIVTIGNYTARIKNYYKQNGVVVLYDVYPYNAQANIIAGMTMTTQDGGETIVLNTTNFIVDFPPSPNPGFNNYDDLEFDINSSSLLVTGGGIVCVDRHFTGKEQTQDYQLDNMIVEDYSKQTNDGYEG